MSNPSSDEKRKERKPRRPQRERLPELLRPFFWEYPFARLSWERDRDLIIGRVLSAGSWNAIQWVRARTGDERLREWIQTREGRGLSRKQLRFWQLILDLPKRQVDAWLEAPGRQVWDRRGES